MVPSLPGRTFSTTHWQQPPGDLILQEIFLLLVLKTNMNSTDLHEECPWVASLLGTSANETCTPQGLVLMTL